MSVRMRGNIVHLISMGRLVAPTKSQQCLVNYPTQAWLSAKPKSSRFKKTRSKKSAACMVDLTRLVVTQLSGVFYFLIKIIREKNLRKQKRPETNSARDSTTLRILILVLRYVLSTSTYVWIGTSELPRGIRLPPKWLVFTNELPQKNKNRIRATRYLRLIFLVISQAVIIGDFFVLNFLNSHICEMCHEIRKRHVKNCEILQPKKI